MVRTVDGSEKSAEPQAKAGSPGLDSLRGHLSEALPVLVGVLAILRRHRLGRRGVVACDRAGVVELRDAVEGVVQVKNTVKPYASPPNNSLMIQVHRIYSEYIQQFDLLGLTWRKTLDP